MTDFEQIKVTEVSEQSYNDPKTGEVRKWKRCIGVTHENQIFSFSRPEDEDVKPGTMYGMYLDKDRYFKAVVKYRKL